MPTLVANKIIFDSGWQGADWYSFAHACYKAIPQLGAVEKKTIEQAILNYTPEIDLAVSILREIIKNGESKPFWTKKSVMYELNRSGYEQWCILETIGEELLSPISLSRLHRLRRKFPKEKIAKPNHMEAQFVGSPIKRVQCAKMKSRHWLSAIKRYDSDNNRGYDHTLFDGGARELATELQKSTQKDPARFSDLCLKIPDAAHYAYIEHILWGLADAKESSDESLIQAVKHAHQHPQKPFGTGIARLVERHPRIAADSELIEMLIWYALNGETNESDDPDTESIENETITIDKLMNRGASYHTRGMNGARGWAWEALGAVLWKVPEVENRVWNAIAIALEKESSIGVRCCMMKPLAPLFDMNKEHFSDSIRSLIVLPDGTPHEHDALRLSPLITQTGIHLFPYIFYWLPELADELATELLKSRDKTNELIGAWLIFRESINNDTYIDKVDKLAAVSVEHRRLLAGVACNAITWAENRYRTEALLKDFLATSKRKGTKAVIVIHGYGSTGVGGSIKMAVRENGREAVTHYRLLKRFREHSHIKVQLETGRTHQIRVHMSYLRHPIVGDPVYAGRHRVPPGAQPELVDYLQAFKRQALHAWRLSFIHPESGEEVTYEAPLPDDMQQLLALLQADLQSHEANS